MHDKVDKFRTPWCAESSFFFTNEVKKLGSRVEMYQFLDDSNFKGMHRYPKEVLFVVSLPSDISHLLTLQNRKRVDRSVVFSSGQGVGHDVEVNLPVENVDRKLTEELDPASFPSTKCPIGF